MKVCKIIDVSMAMDAFTFPMNPVFNLEGPFNRVEGHHPEYVYDFKLCTQSGTHIQGPHYFLKDGKPISDFPLTHFEGQAFVVDSHKRGIDIEVKDLKNLLDGIDLVDKILILRTGHMDELIQEGRLEGCKRPGLSLDAAEYLCDVKKIRMLAIDSVGLESRTSQNYEVNVYLCQKEVLILECLCHLDQVKFDWVWLEAFPLKIEGVEGTPCRAIIKEYEDIGGL